MNSACPSCQQEMEVREIYCPQCDLTMRGHFTGNSFSQLSSEQFQFLQVFVACEGKIRDMERALGMSYPTVKGKLADLKAAFLPSPGKSEARQEERASVSKTSSEPTPPASPAPPSSPSEVLDELAKGNLSYEQALKLLGESHGTRN